MRVKRLFDYISKVGLLRRLTLRGLIAIITFALGITVASIWTLKTRRDKLAQKGNQIAVFSVCDIVGNADTHLYQRVQVRGILTGYHELVLFDPACSSNGYHLLVDLDASSRSRLISLASQQNEPPLRDGNFWLTVLLSARFEPLEASDSSIPHNRTSNQRLIVYKYKLEDVTFEKVSPASVP